MGKKLAKKPLVEAMFELQWGELVNNQFEDRGYPILLGRLYDHFRTLGYTYHEQLPASALPDQLSGHVVQHRFRIGDGRWPLVQVGKGILTVNDVEDYDWDKDFRGRCLNAVRAVYEKHPKGLEEMPFQLISLRYLDAYPFDIEKVGLFDFLQDKMRLQFDFPPRLLETIGVRGSPATIGFNLGYPVSEPDGLFRFRLGRGTHAPSGKPALVWEIEVRSFDAQVPTTIDAVSIWLDQAHTKTSDWFFELISGELEEEFS